MKSKGEILTLVLVFGGVFTLTLGSLVGFIILQHQQSRQKVANFEALAIAESGVNYARWHLAHNPSDFSFGATHEYKDLSAGVIGHFQLNITPPTGCQPAVLIKSTGWTDVYPDNKRTVQVNYAKPALAKYAFLTNNNVWFGESEELQGPFHSNGGIRMDGEQNSLSLSAKETYTCGPEHGCSPVQTKPGIWGNGEGSEKGLWEFPVPAIDFNSITQDLAVLKDEAIASGIHLNPSSTGWGYHLRFINNGTVDVYKITALKARIWGYDGNNWVLESNDIDSETFWQNYNLPGDCGPIFVEDNVWVDGEINGRSTLVAASLPDLSSTNKKIIINGDITQVDANSALGLIAQKDVLIPLYSPDQLEIKATLLAQKGHVFRYYYPNWNYEPYKTYAIRDSLETFGSIITNTIWTFSWVDGGGSIVSGYRNTEMRYDSGLTFNPPPYFPTNGEAEFIFWEELQ